MGVVCRAVVMIAGSCSCVERDIATVDGEDDENSFEYFG